MKLPKYIFEKNYFEYVIIRHNIQLHVTIPDDYPKNYISIRENMRKLYLKYNNMWLFQMIIPKTLGFIGEKSDKLNQGPIISNHNFDKNRFT